MDSFNPTPEWLGDGVGQAWSVLEVWGWPALFATAAFLYLAPQVTQSVQAVNTASYETASPLDDSVRLAREKMQQLAEAKAEEAEKKRKEEAEEKRKERLEELKNGPKTRKVAQGTDYSPLSDAAGGGGNGGRAIGRVTPCAGGG